MQTGDGCRDIAKTVKQWLGLRDWNAIKTSLAVAEAPRDHDLLGQHFSDYGNAERLIARHGADLRYCHAMRSWLVWDGKRWSLDLGERSRELVHDTFRVFLAQAVDARNEGATKFAANCLNTARVSNALREAQPSLAITPEALDTDPWLLNFRNGTVDLRTGLLREHRREDFVTKLVNHDSTFPLNAVARLLTALTALRT